MTAPAGTTPPFFFRIDGLRPTPGVRQREDGNHWRPPRPLGSNNVSHEGTWFCYTGNPLQTMVALTLQPGQRIPPHSAHFQTFSMYYSEGTFWVVNGDASQIQVGNGSQDFSDDEERGGNSDDSDTDDDDPGTMDWKTLKFGNPQPNLNDFTSFATVGAESGRLHVMRPDQHIWISELLPDRYHAAYRLPNPGDTRGGMVGTLSVLLGLIVFSAPESQANAVLRHCIQPNGWRTHGGPRGLGWRDRRGVVVRAYAYAPDGHSNATALTSFENGTPLKAYR